MEQPPLLVFRDKDAIKRTRPDKYKEKEQAAYRRHSSVRASDAGFATEKYRSMVETSEEESPISANGGKGGF